MRGFVQRVIRTLGLPFKSRRERNSFRDIKETWESQTRPLQMRQKDGAQLTNGSTRIATSTANPISILSIDESVAPRTIPPSRASTRHTTESKNEDPRQLHQKEYHGEDESQLTDGPSRVVMAFDGTKDCVALLLTERMITELTEITEETRRINVAEIELREASLKASMAERTAKELNAELAKTEDPNLINDLSSQIETQKEIFSANTSESESLTEVITARSRNLKYGQIAFQNIFRRALEDANLSSLLEVKTETVNPSGAAKDSKDSITVPETDESMVTAEELLRRNAYDDWEYTRDNLAYAQSAFDNRQVKYDRALMLYQERLDEGTTSCTQSEFGRLAVGRTRKLTRALIDAETDYVDAAQRAKALGILMNEVDQESNFVSDISDGYHTSGEASMQAAVDRTFIEYWSDNIVGFGLEELEEPREPDDWDAETVGISESVSVIDHSRNRKRIDRWRKMWER